MEPSQIFGVSEECHSSESGWTMYIGSPANDDSSDAASDDDDEDEEHKGYYYAANNHNDSDDDSMASDASSGPSHQKGNHNPFKGMKNPNGEMNFCLETTRTVRKPLMEKKKKQRAERKEVKVGQKPKTSVQSSSKSVKSPSPEDVNYGLLKYKKLAIGPCKRRPKIPISPSRRPY